MDVSTYAIGVAGQSPRMFITTSDDDAHAQVRDGEVLVHQANYINPPHVISDVGLTLVPATVPLDDLKAAKWLLARRYRDDRQSTTCQTPSGVVQIDSDSQRKIAGAALAAKIAKDASMAFQVEWTMADNSTVGLDADAMIAVGMTVMAYLNACQVACNLIRARILSAGDADSLAAIDITGGASS